MEKVAFVTLFFIHLSLPGITSYLGLGLFLLVHGQNTLEEIKMCSKQGMGCVCVCLLHSTEIIG